MATSFHNYERKLKGRLASIHKSSFSICNKRAILDFADYCFSEGLSVPRVEKYVGHLKRLASLFGKDFARATRGDLEKLVRLIQQSDYSEWTKHDLRLTIKKFYRWLRHTSEDPPETAWIRIGRGCNKQKLPEELLTEEDVVKLTDACYSRRDKAFVSVLYESGCRIGEIASLRIKHAMPNTHGFQLIVYGKTGSRRILIVSSAAYLTDWLNEHPRKSDPESYLWITDNYRNQRLSYSRIDSILRTAAKRADIKKRVNPHTFRHSRATYLANYLTEAQMNEFFGWIQGSDMPSVYVHLSGRDVDNALLRTYGIVTNTNQGGDSKLRPRKCTRCDLENPPGHRFCSRCGTVLDEKTALDLTRKNLERGQADDIMDRLIQDQEFRAMLKRKLEGLGQSSRPVFGCNRDMAD